MLANFHIHSHFFVTKSTLFTHNRLNFVEFESTNFCGLYEKYFFRPLAIRLATNVYTRQKRKVFRICYWYRKKLCKLSYTPNQFQRKRNKTKKIHFGFTTIFDTRNFIVVFFSFLIFRLYVSNFYLLWYLRIQIIH